MDKQREMFEAWWQENRPSCWSADWYAKMQQDMAWRAWQAAIAAQWQPIETAPNDGSFVLAGRFSNGSWCQTLAQQYQGKWIGFASPTHWMTLPPEPTK